VREFFENLPYFKYWGVYMKESNMVHFQAPNGTLNPIVWQNNLNLFVRMLQCVKQENWNEELVEKRKEINMEGFSIKDYRTIYPMQAFEFADIVFPNNLEKVYFLKQYLKSFEIGDTYLEKAKQFTR
ncbi:MAG: hypothetical protein KH135_06690, partial [Firmicutes bacterium]|nr:hypothetical protein [Bacillota bacterium]